MTSDLISSQDRQEVASEHAQSTGSEVTSSMNLTGMSDSTPGMSDTGSTSTSTNMERVVTPPENTETPADNASQTSDSLNTNVSNQSQVSGVCMIILHEGNPC